MDANGKFQSIQAILIFSLVMFLAFCTAQVVQFAFMIPYMDMDAILHNADSRSVIGNMTKNSLMWSLGASSLVMFVGGPFTYLKLAKLKFGGLNDGSKVNLASFLLVGLLVIAFMPLNSFIFELNSKIPFPQFLIEMEKQLEELTKSLTVFDNYFQFILGLLVIAVLAGIGEELTFRGLLQNILNKLFKNHHLGIWVAALIFSTIHMQFLGFFPRLLLGAMFGYLYHYSGSLILAMYAHFVNNGFTVIMVHLYNEKIISMDMESKESLPIQYVISSTILTAGIMFLLMRSFQSSKK